MEHATIETGVEGRIRYLVSYPPAGEQGDGPRPVLCFLHGQGEAVPMPVERSAGLHGPLSKTSWPAARERFVVVEPQRAGLRDDWVADLDAVVRIVRGVQQRHGGDPDRTYLTGFSLGGNGVLDFAAAAAGPDLWAAYWAVDPTRLPAGLPRRPMWVSAGPLTKWDRGFPALRAADDGDKFRVTDEADDHVEAAARAYGRAEVYDWLLARRL
jgi:poly(3-hydroxybutyrate) depolymerase